MHMEIAQRKIAIKKQLLASLGCPGSPYRLFQVWQPEYLLWQAFYGDSAETDAPMQCVSKYLEFPNHYCLAALVEASTCGEVYDAMRDVHLGEDDRIVRLSQLVKTGSPGDVIVSPYGFPNLVSREDTFLPLRKPLLS